MRRGGGGGVKIWNYHDRDGTPKPENKWLMNAPSRKSPPYLFWGSDAVAVRDPDGGIGGGQGAIRSKVW